jgi:tetratricopeptide (TPR) repeat protein
MVYQWIILTLFVWAANESSPQGAITQIQNKILKKDRTGAFKLARELRREFISQDKNLAIFDAEVERAGTLFFTEKGQKDFETAESMYFSLNDNALTNYKSALEGEDGNLLVLSSLAKYYLAKAECSAANDILKLGVVNWPYWLEFKWLGQLVEVCNQLEPSSEVLEAISKKPDYFIYAQSILAAKLIESGRTKEALNKLAALEKKDSQYPETYFYLFKAQTKDQMGAIEDAEKYINLCKTVGAKERRKYSLDPWLCKKVEAVQKEIAKIKGDT